MFAEFGEIWSDFAGRVGSTTDWLTLFLIWAVGYLAIVKIVLLGKLRPVPRKRAVRCAATAESRCAGSASSGKKTIAPSQQVRAARRSAAGAADNTFPFVLTALDWTSIDCQNKQGCNRPADYIVEYHAIDHCLEGETNALGNTVEILCKTCLAFLELTVEMHIDRLISQGRDLKCRACGKALSSPADILGAESSDAPADRFHAARTGSAGNRPSRMSTAVPISVSGL